MHVLYPADSFNPKDVDEVYAAEYAEARNQGLTTSLFNFEEFLGGRFRPVPALPAEATLYRGWMLDSEGYVRLAASVVKAGSRPVTPVDAYLLCHHLPNWYPQMRDFTAETLVFPADDPAIADHLRGAGWTGCFLKDYVKSLSTAGGSLVSDLSTIPEVVGRMRKYRGHIEGGLCARRIEKYEPDTEKRFFVLNGIAHGDSGDPPDIVEKAAAEIKSPFFSVDVARREDGVLRIIELGDGQVSDLKHWDVASFILMLAKLRSS